MAGRGSRSRAPDYGAGEALRAFVDVACFLVELAMLALLAASGWRLGDGGLIGIALAVLYPALAIVVWSIWLARTSDKRLRNPRRFALEAVLFAATTVAAVAGDLTVLGAIFVVASMLFFGLSAVVGESRFGGAHGAGGEGQAGSRSSS